jgi:hypothetical protein
VTKSHVKMQFTVYRVNQGARLTLFFHFTVSKFRTAYWNRKTLGLRDLWVTKGSIQGIPGI